MAIIVLDGGIQNQLNVLINNGGNKLDTYKARLYTNNHTPVHTDAIGAFTEAAWAGYTSQTLSPWGAASVSASVASSLGPVVVFNNTSGGSVNTYGYFATDAGNTTAYFAELFAGAPISIPTGLGLSLQITFQEQSIN